MSNTIRLHRDIISNADRVYRAFLDHNAGE